MSPEAKPDWSEINQRFLSAAIARVRKHLEDFAHRSVSTPSAKISGNEPADRPAPSSPATALETLCAAFRLSAFERDILLLCAGVELDSALASLVASLQPEAPRSGPTFSLALSALPDAHWSALTPSAPLRRFRMIDVAPGQTLTSSPLKIDERILHYLAGISYLDERFYGLVEKYSTPGMLTPSHEAIAKRLANLYAKPTGRQRLPLVQLTGSDADTQKDIAAWASQNLGLHLYMVSAQNIPVLPSELDGFTRLWEREAFLTQSALLLNCHDLDPADKARESALARFASTASGIIVLASPERKHIPQRRVTAFEVELPPTSEQRRLWSATLGERATRLDGRLDHLISQFQLSPQAIYASCDEAIGAPEEELHAVLWDACRRQSRPKLEQLAQRIEPKAGWDDLVLPDPQKEILKTIAANVRLRHRVYETWGFAEKSARGLGVSALFAGASGTGKTLAAEVLARDLRLDLFRIDLSQVVNKYIGETEKNLKRVFDAAEAGGAILLFDEADALFGKRSEVKDSHDRYANIEVSYLLQRMECYRGLAILTTNMKDALDTAFLRRIRFIVQFPFPDAPQRAEIWRRIFPAETPTHNLNADRLSTLHIAGGNIRNIALAAAFLAADGNRPVDMLHIRQAVKHEYAKIEKQLSAAEMAAFNA